MGILPSRRPGLTRSLASTIIAQHGVTDKVVLIGIRGFFLDEGPTAKNDRGVYDDGIVLVTPTGIWTFNANVDPSVFRPKIATLKPGVHRYKKGKHGISRGPGYPALRPATKGELLPVIRDPGVSAMGQAINIHRGSNTTTSSEGCQTLPPAQWVAFQSLVYLEMDRYGQKTIPYILVTNDGRFA